MSHTGMLKIVVGIRGSILENDCQTRVYSRNSFLRWDDRATFAKIAGVTMFYQSNKFKWGVYAACILIGFGPVAYRMAQTPAPGPAEPRIMEPRIAAPLNSDLTSPVVIQDIPTPPTPAAALELPAEPSVTVEAGPAEEPPAGPVVLAVPENGDIQAGGAPDWSVGLPGYGPADAAHVFVMFSDFLCAGCQTASDALGAAMTDRNDIRVVIVEYPFIGPESEQAARISLAALSLRGIGAWMHAHGFLFSAGGHMAERTFDAFAAAEDMEPDELRLAMTSPEVDALLAANRALAERYGVVDQMALIHAGRIIPAPADADAVAALIDGDARP